MRKSPGELAIMDEANRIVLEVLAMIERTLEEGITTAELDAMAEKMIRDMGGIPAFKGYKGYPATLCVSINDEVVHGIPGDRKICDGDIVSVDCGVIYRGYYGDAAKTFSVGEVDDIAKKLLEVTEKALQLGVDECRSGKRVSDIGKRIEKYVSSEGFNVVRKFVGHGIGRSLHEPPEVPNFFDPEKNMKLKTGMVLAIEPMVTVGSYEVVEDEDGWTVRTKDGSLSAHFEYSVAITKNGPRILGLREDNG